jgi:hypothetical protein
MMAAWEAGWAAYREEMEGEERTASQPSCLTEETGREKKMAIELETKGV